MAGWGKIGCLRPVRWMKGTVVPKLHSLDRKLRSMALIEHILDSNRILKVTTQHYNLDVGLIHFNPNLSYKL